MSTLPAAVEPLSITRKKPRFSPAQAAGFAALLAILGLSAVWPTAVLLWNLWTEDALKSIGMFVPLVSFVLVLRVWRNLGWEMDGSWWGLVILVVTAAVVHIRNQSILIFVLSPKWSIYVPPHSLVAFAYGAGVVLLFGGPRLFRAALFPIALLWFVNPIPHIFNVFVDLPLQRISAHVARGFAIALGQPLSPDQMRLMFTPQFGMFIAPGCNGIRGAVTMGFIALIAGYVYRFRWYAHAAVILCAVLLGYVFNFARLCGLVLYYLVALHFTSLQHRAKLADYIIGACLFLFATFLLFYVISRLRESPNQLKPAAAKPLSYASVRWSSVYPRFAAMLAFVVFGLYGAGRAVAYVNSPEFASKAGIERYAAERFPARIGSYTLARSWNENVFGGTLIFHWGEYAPDDGGAHISLGVSPVLGSHDTLLCHLARGEDPLWKGQLTVPTAGNVPISFSTSLFNNGASQYLEATTICNSGSCGEYSSERSHFGFIYSKPTSQSVFSQDPHRPIPIMLRVETIDTTLPVDVARQQLSAALSSFLASADLNSLTQPYRQK
jgi:exosortase J